MNVLLFTIIPLVLLFILGGLWSLRGRKPKTMGMKIDEFSRHLNAFSGDGVRRVDDDREGPGTYHL